MSTKKKAKEIENRLIDTLLNNGVMAQALYEYDLADRVSDLKSSMKKDKDDYIFAINENTSDIAMLLIEKSGQTYVNEQAREKLKTLWLAAYEKNVKTLIPFMAKQLSNDELPINGVKLKTSSTL